MVCQILASFADASSLRTNLAKSVILPVRCSEEQIVAALAHFPATRGSFPCTYLGLPLHHSRLKAVHFFSLFLTSWVLGWQVGKDDTSRELGGFCFADRSSHPW